MHFSWLIYRGTFKSLKKQGGEIMQSIKITITTGNSPSIVITELKTDSQEDKRKAALAYLDAMFKPVIKEVSK